MDKNKKENNNEGITGTSNFKEITRQK